MAKNKNRRPNNQGNIWKKRYYLLLSNILGVAPLQGASMGDIKRSLEIAILGMPSALKKQKVNGVPVTMDPEIPDNPTQILLFALLCSKLYKGMDYENAVDVVRNWYAGSSLASGGGSQDLAGLAADAEDETFWNNLGDFADPSDGGFAQDLGDLFGDLFDFDGDGDINPFN